MYDLVPHGSSRLQTRSHQSLAESKNHSAKKKKIVVPTTQQLRGNGTTSKPNPNLSGKNPAHHSRVTLNNAKNNTQSEPFSAKARQIIDSRHSKNPVNLVDKMKENAISILNNNLTSYRVSRRSNSHATMIKAVSAAVFYFVLATILLAENSDAKKESKSEDPLFTKVPLDQAKQDFLSLAQTHCPELTQEFPEVVTSIFEALDREGCRTAEKCIRVLSHIRDEEILIAAEGPSQVGQLLSCNPTVGVIDSFTYDASSRRTVSSDTGTNPNSHKGVIHALEALGQRAQCFHAYNTVSTNYTTRQFKEETQEHSMVAFDVVATIPTKMTWSGYRSTTVFQFNKDDLSLPLYKSKMKKVAAEMDRASLGRCRFVVLDLHGDPTLPTLQNWRKTWNYVSDEFTKNASCHWAGWGSYNLPIGSPLTHPFCNQTIQERRYYPLFNSPESTRLMFSPNSKIGFTGEEQMGRVEKSITATFNHSFNLLDSVRPGIHRETRRLSSILDSNPFSNIIQLFWP